MHKVLVLDSCTCLFRYSRGFSMAEKKVHGSGLGGKGGKMV